MYKLVVLSILLCVITPAFSFNYGNTNNNFQSKLKMKTGNQRIITHEAPRRNYMRRYNHNYYIQPENLNALERYAFNRAYNREHELSRLERLENLAFGATQSGDIISRYNNVESAILSRPKYSTRNTMLGNLANYFVGQPTGYTPSIIPSIPNFNNNFTQLGGDSTFPSFLPTSGYNNGRVEGYSNGIFGGGWGMMEQSTGSGTSVKILD